MNMIIQILSFIVLCGCFFYLCVAVYILVDTHFIKKRLEKEEQDEIKKYVRNIQDWDEKMRERTNRMVDLAVQEHKDAEKRLQQYLMERDGLPLDYFDCP